MKKLPSILASLLLLGIVGAYSGSSAAAGGGCHAPSWWPTWLPYYCQEN